jgi:kynureninase
MDNSNILTAANEMDMQDPLADFRHLFHFPKHNNKDCIYFCGNSLGLMPKSTPEYLLRETRDWANLGVSGHHEAEFPWLSYHELFSSSLARIVGARPTEVVAMNSLTVNLHLLMISFYRPTKDRFKVVIVGNEFPSDRYAVTSQIQLHGFSPQDSLIEVMPSPGTMIVEESDIEKVIADNSSEIALVLLSGVHYYTGQRFDIQRICKAAHEAGALFGTDLAHAIGNVELQLHDWNVDFAVWCSYKYLNSGPGGVGGAFVHENHEFDEALPRLAGWWGNDQDTRFEMQHDFVPAVGAVGWQLSNAPVLSMAAHKASMDIFDMVDLSVLYAKRDSLTKFLFDTVNEISNEFTFLKVASDPDPRRRGAQLSLNFSMHGKEVFNRLANMGVVVDWRNPSVIRVAPAPLYNSYTDVANFGILLENILKELTDK